MNIPESVYVEAEIDNAMATLYENKVEPQDYAEYLKKRFAREYEHEQMVSAHQDNGDEAGDL